MIDMQEISIFVDLARTMEEERVTLRRAQLCLDWNIARHAPCFSMPGNNATPTCARGDEPSATWLEVTSRCNQGLGALVVTSQPTMKLPKLNVCSCSVSMAAKRIMKY